MIGCCPFVRSAVEQESHTVHKAVEEDDKILEQKAMNYIRNLSEIADEDVIEVVLN